MVYMDKPLEMINFSVSIVMRWAFFHLNDISLYRCGEYEGNQKQETPESVSVVFQEYEWVSRRKSIRFHGKISE